MSKTKSTWETKFAGKTKFLLFHEKQWLVLTWENCSNAMKTTFWDKLCKSYNLSHSNMKFLCVWQTKEQKTYYLRNKSYMRNNTDLKKSEMKSKRKI